MVGSGSVIAAWLKWLFFFFRNKSCLLEKALVFVGRFNPMLALPTFAPKLLFHVMGHNYFEN